MIKRTLLFSLYATAWLHAATNPQPPVIPAVKEWQGAEGSLKLDTSRIFIHPKHTKELRPIATLLTTELGKNAEVVVSDKLAKRAIFLTIDPSIKTKEGYETTWEKFNQIV